MPDRAENEDGKVTGLSVGRSGLWQAERAARLRQEFSNRPADAAGADHRDLRAPFDCRYAAKLRIQANFRMLLSGLERRTFLHAAGTAALAGAAAGCGASKSPWRFFTAEEARSLEAICEAIIPADRDPGAAAAGVVHYIDRQLMGKFREHRKPYRAGIAAGDRIAGGRAVDAAVIRDIEHAAETRAFFDLVVAHTMQGFYGNPRHGGNREFVSWRMLRIPISPVRGRNRYEKS
jgi:gluconate 2-dehydrogenase gamma chain